MKHIVKRHGASEKFDERKLYASVYSACLAVTVPVGEAELVADKVSKDVIEDIAEKHEVTSTDIFHKTAKHLSCYNADAGYIYEHSHKLGQ